MPKENNINDPKKIAGLLIILALLVLSFFIIKSFVIAIIGGFILAFILSPVDKIFSKFIKSKTISALLICILTIVILAFATYFIAQVTIKEAFNMFSQVQKVDIYNVLNDFLLKLFPGSPDFTRQITLSIQQALISFTSSFVTTVGKILTEAPLIGMQFFVAFFVAYYVLKDRDNINSYLRQLLPFDKQINEKLIKKSGEITSATIYGQIIVGIIQGLVAGIGFYIFGAPSPLFFTLLAILFAMLPVLGPFIVWIPVGLIMIATGHTTNGLLLLAFGAIVVSFIDNILRPFIISKYGKISPVIVLLGMFGGLIFLGPLGIIIGPLVLEYLFIFVELYRTDISKIND